MHPLKLLFGIKERSDVFWRTLGNCITAKKMFYLSHDKKDYWYVVMPKFSSYIVMEGEVKISTMEFESNGKFMQALKQLCIINDKINPCGETTELENRIDKDASGLD
jgi:hypothetical protein